MGTRTGRSALVSVIAAFVLLAPLGSAHAMGKSGAQVLASDSQTTVITNQSARGSVAKATAAPQIRNLSARGSLAQVGRSSGQKDTAAATNEVAETQ